MINMFKLTILSITTIALPIEFANNHLTHLWECTQILFTTLSLSLSLRSVIDIKFIKQ